MKRPDQFPSSVRPWPRTGGGSRPHHEGLELFSRTKLQHRLAIGLLQILELLLVLFADVDRVGAQRVLHPALGILDPALNLRG